MKIVPLTLREANDFVEAHHRHSARTSNDAGKYAIGLTVDDVLVGVAIVGRPVGRLFDRAGSAELLRCCVSSIAPRNATSRLTSRAKRIWQLMGGERFVTYTLQSESGASMRGAGLAHEADVAARRWTTPSRPRAARAIEGEPKLRWGVNLAEVPA